MCPEVFRIVSAVLRLSHEQIGAKSWTAAADLRSFWVPVDWPPSLQSEIADP